MMKYTPDFSSRFRILKGGKISLVVSALLAGTTISFAAPSGGVVTSGNANISQSGNTTTINQSTNKASINWQSFSIAPNEIVNFNQPSSTSVTLNRVVGTTNSLIQGAMNANGQVILINPNGVVFTEGSTINVGGLIATTKNITDANFQSGNYIFEGDSEASILNRGTINAKYVAMMGKVVANEGTIVATLGRVELAGGDKFTLNLNGDSLLSLRIDEGTLNALVENKGLIKADGGVVYLTTKAVDSILDGMVNNTGIIEAQTLNNIDGEIVLFAHGGTANVAGEIKAEGGFVETSGAKVDLKDDLKIKTKNWLIDPYDIEIVGDSVTETSITPLGGTYTAPSDSTKIKASTLTTALNAGTDVTVTTAGAGTQNGDITVNSAISWTSDSDLTLRADRNININQDITATGANAKLTLEYGQTTANSDYNIARNVKINLADGQNFSTKNGSDAVVDYTVVNSTSALATALPQNSSANVALGSDIDLDGVAWTSVYYFTGKFSGLGHTIDNLNNTTRGLFEWAHNADLRDVGITNVNITATGAVGALAGYASGITTIKNAYSTGTITTANSYVGGLVGSLEDDSVISNSYSTVNITSTHWSVGGLVGSIEGEGAVIKNSYASGNVQGSQRVGGLVGEAIIGTIENAYALGNVTATEPDNNAYAGGLIGEAVPEDGDLVITNVYAAGKVNGTGGSGNLIGGLIGSIDDTDGTPTITNAYWDTTTTGQQYQAGDGTEITGAIEIADAYTQATFTGFDFNNDWFMVDGYTRPFLRSEWTTAVRNAHELQLMSMNLTQDYKLVSDIDLAPSLTNISEMWKDNSTIVQLNDYKGSFASIGNADAEENYFTGSLDGQNKTISNLYIDRPLEEKVGLFGFANTASFKDLTLASVNIVGYEEVGALAGAVDMTTIIDNVNVSGTVSGNSSVGGLVGDVSGTSIIKNSSSSVTVSGVAPDEEEDDSPTYIGGLVGYLNDSTIEDSSASGTVTATDDPTDDLGSIGGLVGSVDGSTIRRSTASGDVSGGTTGVAVGGLAGYTTDAIIEESSATGNVTGNSGVGGLVGDLNYYSSISDSHATGEVNGVGQVGGLVGYMGAEASITDSYSESNVVGTDAYVGGLVGFSDGDSTTKNTITGSHHKTGTVEGLAGVGGLVGVNFNTDITDSYATSDVTGSMYVGGLVGSADNSDITTSYATGSVTETAGYFDVDVFEFVGAAGGLVGEMIGGSITDSHATGTVEGVSVVGGLVGKMSETDITESHATGDVTATGFEDEEEGIAVGSAGGLVGEMYGGSITGSYAEGKVVGTVSVGGLVGLTDEDLTMGEITNSHATGDVEGDWSVGGLIGDNYTAEITHAYATGSVTGIGTSNKQIGGLIGSNYAAVTESYATGDVEGAEDVGGLIGGNSEAVISRSFATGSVTGVDSDYYDNIDIGGLVGYNYGGAIVDSYATGDVSGTEKVGGLVGWNDGDSTVSSITNSYAVGSVTGTTAVGGLVGDNTDGLIYDSFWDTETSGQSNGVGVAGTVDNVVGKTTAQMKNYYTYPLGDGGEIMGWEIVEDSSLSNVYPQLRWATDGLGNGTSVWVIAQGTPPSNGGSGEQAQQEQIQTQINDIVTTIVNQTTTSSTNNPTVAPMTPVAVAPLSTTQPTNREMINLAMPGSSYDLVASPSGQDPVSNMEFTDLQRVAMANGLSEIRVPLGNNSIVELVNGGMNTGPVDQLFFVVDGKRNDDGVNNKTKKEKKN